MDLSGEWGNQRTERASRIQLSGIQVNLTQASGARVRERIQVHCAIIFTLGNSHRKAVHTMNIQIFGKKKSSDTRKAERFFKERGIRFQSVDMKEKGLSKGEFQSVLQAVGSLEAMIDPNCKDKDLLLLIKYLAEEDRAQKVLDNQSVLKLPIVRNGRQATVGYQPEVWKKWE